MDDKLNKNITIVEEERKKHPERQKPAKRDASEEYRIRNE